MIISGTKGYIYVPSPWWKTEYFEVRFENFNDNKRYFYKINGTGERYQIAEFMRELRTNENKRLLNIEKMCIRDRYQTMYHLLLF